MLRSSYQTLLHPTFRPNSLLQVSSIGCVFLLALLTLSLPGGILFIDGVSKTQHIYPCMEQLKKRFLEKGSRISAVMLSRRVLVYPLVTSA